MWVQFSHLQRLIRCVRFVVYKSVAGRFKPAYNAVIIKKRKYFFQTFQCLNPIIIIKGTEQVVKCCTDISCCLYILVRLCYFSKQKSNYTEPVDFIISCTQGFTEIEVIEYNSALNITLNLLTWQMNEMNVSLSKLWAVIIIQI